MTRFHLFIPITKVDEERRTVAGWATTEKVDKQNEIVDYEASKKAFDDWHGNIREMHEPKAVGKAISVKHDDGDRRIYVTAKISKGAEDTWEKVKDGTLTGFSIGGQTIDKISQIVKDDDETKQVTRITKYKLNELSLVDNPANPEAEFELVKSVGGQLLQTQVIEDDVTKEIKTKKYHGGEYETMALSKKTLTEIGELVTSLGKLVKGDWVDPNHVVGSAKKTPNQTTEGKEVAKADGDWEDPNREVGSAKKTPNQTTEGKEVEKADMETDSDLQTQDEDGSDAAPVTKLYKQNEDGEMEEATEEDAKKFLKADMETDSDLQTQDEDGSDAAPVTKAEHDDAEDEDVEKAEHDMKDEDDEKKTTKRYHRKAEHDYEEDDDTEKAYDDEDEDDTEKAYDDEEDKEETTKTRKRYRKQADEDEEDEDETEKAYDEDEEDDTKKTVMSELRKISNRLTKIETTPMPRKYHKVEKSGDSTGDGEAELIQKTTDDVKSATETARVTGIPCTPEIEKKREWLLNKSFDRKFGTSDLRKV